MSPKRNANHLVTIAALTGASAVALGAFGAHALKDRLVAAGMLNVWETAVFYHLMHAGIAATAGLFGPTATSPTLGKTLRQAGWCWLIGVLFFSGSLYGLALGGPRILGPVTPLGGLAFLAGWCLLAIGAWKQRNSAA